MDGFVVVERTAVGGGLPNDLPSNIAGREQLEHALQNAGLAIVAVERVEEAHLPSPGATRSDGKSRLRAELEALVNEADESDSHLEAAATASRDVGLDERFWGPAPDSVTAAEAVVADLVDQFAQRRDLAANSFGRQEAAKLLSISPQSVTDKLESRKLVGIKVGREWRLPRWQFDPDKRHRRTTRPRRLTGGFSRRTGKPLAMGHAPQPRIGGRTPLAMRRWVSGQRLGDQGGARTPRGRIAKQRITGSAAPQGGETSRLVLGST